MKKLDLIEQLLQKWQREKTEGMTAREVAEKLMLDRSTASRYLNELVKSGRACKLVGRPVRYLPISPQDEPEKNNNLGNSLHRQDDLNQLMEEALAALLYPPHGLPILLTGETGVGKTYLAKKLVEFAIKKGYLPSNTPFVAFNCAEYAQNPELLLAQLFGVKRGAFTGAEADKPGLVERADGGILFLDEIHRLPPSGQEMLFYLIDQGTYRRLGETAMEREANIRLIGATTEPPERSLLPTLVRRFSVRLEIPPLRKRPRKVREKLLHSFLKEEADQMGVPLTITDECRTFLMTYDCPGNIGQLKSDIQIACARAFLRNMRQSGNKVVIKIDDLPNHLRQGGTVTAAVESVLTNEIFAANPAEKPENIYKQLLEAKETLLKQNTSSEELNRRLQETVNRYIKRLAQYDGTDQIDSQIYKLLSQALDKWGDKIPKSISHAQLKALALHIQSFLRQPTRQSIPKSWANQLNVESVYQELAEKIAHLLEKELAINLPPDELALISLFFSLDHLSSAPRKRLIATVCLTGEGAAVSLADWLREHLPPTDRDVEIRAVQIDPRTRKSPELERLQEEFRLLAVVGTAPPQLEGVPYIPAWELYQQRGYERLKKLLASSRYEEPNLSAPFDFRHIPALMREGLMETVTHFNPKRYTDIIESEAEAFRRLFGWDAEREIGIWMHLGIYTDQLLNRQRTPTQELNTPSTVAGTKLPQGHVEIWNKLLFLLEKTFHVRYPPATAHEMARLSNAP